MVAFAHAPVPFGPAEGFHAQTPKEPVCVVATVDAPQGLSAQKPAGGPGFAQGAPEHIMSAE